MTHPLEALFGKPLVDLTSRLSKEALRQLESPTSATFAQLSQLSDPQNQTAGNVKSLNNTAKILLGKVVDTTSIANLYKVSLERSNQIMIGVLCTDTSLGVYGAKSITTLLPGTTVECVRHDDMSYLSIVGVIPPKNTDRRYAQQQVLHGATAARTDDAHRKPFRMSQELVSATAGRLFDSAGGGEAGWVTETGMRMFIDPFMAMYGLDEMSSLSFFYHDMFTKFAAYNYQHWTSVSESQAMNDQDEALHWNGYATYPWENLGLAARADNSTIQTPREWQIDKPYLAKMDLLNPYSMPWHRLREWYGYLGQGGKRTLVAMPINFTTRGDAGSSGLSGAASGNRTQTAVYGTGDIQPGLADQFTTLGGHIGIQSVKAISITKRGVVSAPTRVAKPESPDGDTENDYKFSGLLGSGPEHRITGDIAGSNPRQKLAGLSDMHSYIYNYASLHPFLYHRKDYAVPEESAAEYAGGRSAEVPNFSELRGSQHINTERYQREVQIDHRYGGQKVYSLEGSVDILENGDVSIHNGCGAEIRLVNGDIEISCPGDIRLTSGRGTHVIAGRDFTARAKKNVELSATEQDVRIKAENNLSVLAGNNGSGGVMIESKGEGGSYDFNNPGTDAVFSGIILKSSNSPLVTISNNVYSRTLGGPYVIDTMQGAANFITYSRQIVNYTDSGEVWYFNTVKDTSEDALPGAAIVNGPGATLSATQTSLPGDVLLSGDLQVGGTALVGRDVLSLGNVASSSGGLLGRIGDAARRQTMLRQQIRRATVTVPKRNGQDLYDSTFAEWLYAEVGPGNEDVLAAMSFTFRTDEQYNTDGYYTFETRWQQLARTTDQVGETWSERPVNSMTSSTYPYPGRIAFTTDTFVQQDFTMFDAMNGRAVDRGMSDTGPAAVYASPSYATQTFTNLSKFPVI